LVNFFFFSTRTSLLADPPSPLMPINSAVYMIGLRMFLTADVTMAPLLVCQQVVVFLPFKRVWRCSCFACFLLLLRSLEASCVEDSKMGYTTLLLVNS
jgi:hypothetical protein